MARFLRFEGGTDSSRPTFFRKHPATVFLNQDNPHITNLIDLVFRDNGRHENLAAHFLAREIFFDPELKYSISQREQLLSHDLTQRFHSDSSMATDLDALLADILAQTTIQL